MSKWLSPISMCKMKKMSKEAPTRVIKAFLSFVKESECLLWGVKEQSSGPGFVLESFVWDNTVLHHMWASDTKVTRMHLETCEAGLISVLTWISASWLSQALHFSLVISKAWVNSKLINISEQCVGKGQLIITSCPNSSSIDIWLLNTS